MRNETEIGDVIADLVAVLVELGDAATRAGGVVMGPTWAAIVTDVVGPAKADAVLDALTAALERQAAEHHTHAAQLRAAAC